VYEANNLSLAAVDIDQIRQVPSGDLTPLNEHASHLFLRRSQSLVEQAQPVYLLIVASLEAVPLIAQLHTSLLQADIGVDRFVALTVLRHARLPQATVDSDQPRGLKGELWIVTLETSQSL